MRYGRAYLIVLLTVKNERKNPYSAINPGNTLIKIVGNLRRLSLPVWLLPVWIPPHAPTKSVCRIYSLKTVAGHSSRQSSRQVRPRVQNNAFGPEWIKRIYKLDLYEDWGLKRIG
jgi:hypothetical protein